MLTSLLSNRTHVKIGYVPLLDSAPLIIAKEAGFFKQQGLDVDLSREFNWASIRDKLALGIIDAAHLLAPMVIASQLNTTTKDTKKTFKTALALGYNGNAFTISNELHTQLELNGLPLAQALGKLKEYSQNQATKLIIGTVHSHSMHTLLIHLLLRAAGISADQVEIKVIPPVHMVSAMQENEVDLFCVGEPWNTAAQIEQAGKILCYGNEIFAFAPEKVLAVNVQFAENKDDTHQKMLRAILQACQWLEQPDHMAQSAIWLSSEEYLDCSSDLLIQAMVNQWHISGSRQQTRKIFFDQHANAPWPAHAEWIKTAMEKFQLLGDLATTSISIEEAYDMSTYTQVLEALESAVPDFTDMPEKPPEL